MKAYLFAIAWMLFAAAAACAEPKGWAVVNSGGAQTLMFDGFADNDVFYKFSCAGPTLTATEIGVTQLMNVADGKKVEDTPGALMAPGVAVMALFTDQMKPVMTAAEAKPNARLRWDLSITLPLNDPAVRALPKAKSLSLMTAGWTGLAELGQADRATISGFLKHCEAAP